MPHRDTSLPSFCPRKRTQRNAWGIRKSSILRFENFSVTQKRLSSGMVNAIQRHLRMTSRIKTSQENKQVSKMQDARWGQSIIWLKKAVLPFCTQQRQINQPSLQHHLSPSKLLLLLSRFRCVRLCATPYTAAHQAPPLGLSRQEHWSGLPFPSPMNEREKRKWSRSVVSDS